MYNTGDSTMKTMKLCTAKIWDSECIFNLRDMQEGMINELDGHRPWERSLAMVGGLLSLQLMERSTV